MCLYPHPPQGNSYPLQFSLPQKNRSGSPSSQHLHNPLGHGKACSGRGGGALCTLSPAQQLLSCSREAKEPQGGRHPRVSSSPQSQLNLGGHGALSFHLGRNCQGAESKVTGHANCGVREAKVLNGANFLHFLWPPHCSSGSHWRERL